MIITAIIIGDNKKTRERESEREMYNIRGYCEKIFRHSGFSVPRML